MKICFYKDFRNINFGFSFLQFLILVAFMISCGRANIENKNKEIQRDLFCQAISLDVDFFIPLKINLINGRFFITDFHGYKMIHEIKLGSYAWIGDFGIRGQGPVEFIGPLSTWEFGQNLYVFDRQGFKLGYFDVMTSDNLSVYKYNDLFNVQNSISKLINIDNKNYLAAGYFPEGRYAILDSLGRVKGYFGTYPDYMVGEEKIPYDAKAMFHQVKFAANYELQRVVAASEHVLDIIDFSEHNPKILSRVKIADYAFDYQSGNRISADLKNGFMYGARSVTSCDQFIYVLFNSVVKGAGETNGPGLTEIIIFDWDGCLIGKRQVQCNLSLIKAIDCSKLYGITEELDFISLEL